ncbi:hypothetical protein INT08_06570 [Prosthecochloris sp. N3]|uniref:Radical SAM protein n=1 Tax=Prosthecochloris ethylica TaxID=2743976 RepID=A0ABR9XS10_9CHLB|nr:radical SAM protein [Prosthecochloris ethylica]MBF0585301.1 hypothetical protein [Prosthecochloris ethylica]MBF0636837.1 hypothetical protein [Prosthecochloris ethylica]NUK46530.1 hypothetical protein [Prosthecochloris ethylica]
MQAHKRFPWFIHSLATNLSTTCPAGCKHCLWQARQERIASAHTFMSHNEMQALSTFGKLFGIREIVASGGEPFSRPKALETLSGLCSRADLGLHAITSAVWADSMSTAEDMLAKTAPWSRIAVSIDDFHQESIPLRNCIHVLDAANKLEISATIATVDGAESILEDIPEKIRRKVPVVSQPLMGMRPLLWKELEGPCINMAVPYCEDGDKIYGCCGDLCEMGEKSPVFFGRTCDLAQNGIADERITLIKYLRLFGPLQIYKDMTGEKPCGTSPFKSQCELCTATFSRPDAFSRTNALLCNERTLSRISFAEAILFSNTRQDRGSLNHMFS